MVTSSSETDEVFIGTREWTINLFGGYARWKWATGNG
jgi:hypothetical protein